MPAATAHPALSVVIAVEQTGPALRDGVAGFAAQVTAAGGEVLLVDATPDAKGAELASGLPGVCALRQPPGTSVPRMWQVGIEAARGEIVALTIGQCRPAADWAQRVLEAHGEKWVAVGGAIEPDGRLELRDWAIYFCRYSRYGATGTARVLDDLAGDNCSYHRATLAEYREAMREGFWESLIHARMRANGIELRWEPRIAVHYAGPLHGFSRRRFADARYFAARRSKEMGVEQRVLRALAFPLVALVLLARMAGRVWRAGRHRGHFVLSLPLVAWYVMVWAAGEAAGYLFGAPPQPPLEDTRIADERG